MDPSGYVVASPDADTIRLQEGNETPTIEGLWNYEYQRDNPEMLDDPSWHAGLADDTVADIKASLRHPDQMSYFQLTPARKPRHRPFWHDA